MNLTIGFRTLKTAIGVSLSIFIAQAFGLHNFATAGILTILCIQNTKKQSLITSRNRFIGALITIALCYVLYEGVMFHPLLVGTMLLLYIPLAVALNMSDTIVTSGVIGLHLYSFGKVDYSIILNEISIISIGILVALFVNLFMPSLDEVLDENTKTIESNFKSIFREIVSFLKTSDSNWTGIELLDTAELIQKSKRLSMVEYENKLFQKDNLYHQYFELREKQLIIIERVLPYISTIPHTIIQSELVANFIEEMASNIHSNNTIDQFLPKLASMRENFKQMELPKTRTEFEIRAALFHFVREMENYLLLKKDFQGLKEGS